ncbi:MAG: hypothetical protein ABSH35_33705 [Isosphaeraceae bacterium]|jgi:hypothetical protein
MRRGLVIGWRWLAVLLLAHGGWSSRAQSGSDDLETRLGLADLAAYRAALSGKTTADDAHAAEPVPPVTFHDLWDHPENWRGRRVQVRGTVARIFRQDAVGGFPPLAEAWLSTPQGDLFCTVFPTAGVPDVGQKVTFTGRFLKTIRYVGSDQPRLAPWIVGDRPPSSAALAPRANEPAAAAAAFRAIGASPEPEPEWERQMGRRFESWLPGAWMLGIALGLAGAGVLAWQHVRRPLAARPRGTLHKNQGSAAADPPLVFLETESVNGTALPDARSH